MNQLPQEFRPCWPTFEQRSVSTLNFSRLSMIVGGVHLKSTQISPDWTEETRDFLRIDFREQDLDLHVFVVLLCSMLL